MSLKTHSKRRRRIVWAALSLSVLMGLIIGGVLLQDWHISRRGAGRVFSDIEDVPAKPVALVLGTSKHVNGRINLFYRYRVEAAAELFAAQKVQAILVSGDNSRKDYNEPQAFRQDLIRLGVPDEYITLDYAGFRTLDSIVRARKVFGVDSIVIVSQPFHCERALYLADRQGLDAVAFAARDVGGRSGLKIRAREALARTKALLDLNLLGTKPKFLGEPVPVKLAGRGPRPNAN